MALPGSVFGMQNRRTIRGMVNPLDKSTIVSIYPKPIDEYNPTIQPGRFMLAAGSYENPSILVVGPSSWWKELEEDQPLLEIPVSSIQVADSFVKDYCNGIFCSNMSDMMPGLFFVLGEESVKSVRMKYPHLLEKAKSNQDRWYDQLVKEADSLWARSNGNPLAISEDMIMAARALGLEKDWTADIQQLEMIKCKACGTLNRSNTIICPNCKVVLDAEKFKTLNLQFAG